MTTNDVSTDMDETLHTPWPSGPTKTIPGLVEEVLPRDGVRFPADALSQDEAHRYLRPGDYGTASGTEGATTASSANSTSTACAEEDRVLKRFEAAEKVLNTVELIEHIISFLPYNDIVRVRGVNKYVKILIQTSKKLHQSIFTNSPEVVWAWHTEDMVRFHGSVRFHESLAPRGKYFRVLCNINKALTTDIFKPDFQQELCCLIFSFEGKELLKLAETEDFDPDDYVAGEYASSARLRIDPFSKHAVMHRAIQTNCLTLGELATIIRLQAEGDRRTGLSHMPLRVSVDLYDCYWEGSEFVRNAKRCFRVNRKQVEYSEEWELKEAVERAGREIFKHLPEEKVARGARRD